MPSGDRPAAGWQPDSRLFDDLPIAVVAVDLAGAPVYLNAVAAGLLADDADVDAPVATAAVFDDAAGTLAEILRHVEAGGTWAGPLPLRWQGQHVTATTSWTPRRLDGQVVGALVIVEPAGGQDRAARQLAGRLSRLAAVTTELLTATDVETVSSVVTQHMADAAGATVASLSLLEGETLRLIGLRGARAHTREQWATFPLAARTPVGDCLRERRPLVMAGRAEIERRYPGLELATEGERSMVCLPLLASGSPVGGLSLSFPGVHVFDRAELEFFGILADSCAQAVARIRATSEASERELKLAFLADASSELASSLDYESTLAAVAHLAVPRFADWCVIQLLQDGVLRTLAMAHPEAVGEEWIRELQDRYPPDPDAPRGAHHVARTGVSELVPEITDEMIAAAAVDEEHQRVLTDLNFRSALVVPLKVHSRVLGVVTWVAGAGGRRYGPEDQAFGEDLARRAAVAIDNAELHSQIRDIALRLQQAVLPERLPHADGWEVAVRYLPSGRTDTGGDFYDLVPLDEGSVAVCVGDVMGRGVEAASAMAQTRSALRALVAVDPEPEAVLSGLDRFFDRFGSEQLVTLVYAVIDPLAGRPAGRPGCRLRLINAGHPAPVVVRADGQVEMLDAGETLLLGAGGGLRDVVVRDLAESDTLMLFTDGLAERRGEVIDQGYERIVFAARTLRDPDLQGTLDTLVDAVRDPTRDDDVAALAIRRKAAQTVPSAAAEPPGDTHLTWLLPSDGRSAGVARRHLEGVLAGMPAATVDTALLLTSEVVTNATAHGGGLVTLTVDLDDEGLRVEVCDESPRRPVPREESLLAEGGRGLHIVDALAADWGARPDKRGKKVWFRLPVPGRRGVR